MEDCNLRHKTPNTKGYCKKQNRIVRRGTDPIKAFNFEFYKTEFKVKDVL